MVVICSKLISDIEVEPSAAGPSIFLDGNAIINSQRANWQIQPQAKSKVRAPVLAAHRIGIFVHIAPVHEERPPGLLDNGESQLDRPAGHRPATDRFAMLVTGSNVSIGKAAKIVRPT